MLLLYLVDKGWRNALIIKDRPFGFLVGVGSFFSTA